MAPQFSSAHCTEFCPEFLSNLVPVLAPGRLFRHWMLGLLVRPPSSSQYPSICVKQSTPGGPDWGNKAGTYGMGRTVLYFPSPLQGSDATLLNRDSSNNHDHITCSTLYSAFPPFSPPKWIVSSCVTLFLWALAFLYDNLGLREWLLVSQYPHFSNFWYFSLTGVPNTDFIPFIS